MATKLHRLSVEQLDENDLMTKGIYDEPGWWVHDPNNTDVPWSGPYSTKAEAEDTRRGLERFWRANLSLLSE